jgi:hypothetical protein
MKLAVVFIIVTRAAAATRAVPAVVHSLHQRSSGGHPTLSDRWTSFVQEDEVGWVRPQAPSIPSTPHHPLPHPFFLLQVYESYKMVQEPTVKNPSGKWTNFTDGSCKELIYVTDDDLLTARYLLKCDAVDCCHEEQDGNHDEYQIPNVHPAFLAPVTYAGTEQVEVDPDQGDPFFVKADVWHWSFLLEKFYALTVNNTDGPGVGLLRWTVELEGQQYNDTYLNYTAPAANETSAFDAQFQIPEVCQGNILPCDNAFKSGHLSEVSYKRFKRRATRPRADRK